MIEILIITDNVFDLARKIIDGNYEYTVKNGIVFINTPLLSLVVTSEINEGSIRQRWNSIILNKDISFETYQKILLPSLSPIIDLRNYDGRNMKII